MVIESSIFEGELLKLIKVKDGYEVKWCSLCFCFDSLRKALDYYEKFGK